MENGVHNGGAPSNHDRNHDDDGALVAATGATAAPLTNGVGRAVDGSDDASRARLGETNGAPAVNGIGGGYGGTADNAPPDQPGRMNDLPSEIQHVSDNFVPLGFLLGRLAQKTHNNLQDVIRELARKPVAGMAINGSTDSPAAAAVSGTEDGSVENVEKKKRLLEFARSEHANWVKALVITEWSKKATQISKLIDLENHMFEEELVKYEQAVFTMLNLKRNLHAARVPSPDLKTALQVLSQGRAPWMPDLGFIEAPPLTAEEQLRWLEDISTLLSLRLNLEEHESLPPAFRDYTIASGRATFHVAGEFEVDVTLASDDFSEQLWFLDVRFLFRPAPAALTDGLRQALEKRVNGVLATEGLAGCYRLLHEYVLTHKVNELRRQALALGRGRWIETLRVEALNRAVSIQYWTARSGSVGVKSWIIVGVHSGRPEPDDAGAAADAPAVVPGAATSRLGLRWFRDGREVREASELVAARAVLADVDTVSAEQLLLAVVGGHVAHMLRGLQTRLAARPLYAMRKAWLRLHVSATEPGASCLELQVTHRERVVVRLDPVTGQFAMQPQSRIVAHGEARVNAAAAASATGGKDPVDEAYGMLDQVRCAAAQEELGRRAKSAGWTVVRGVVVRPDELRQVVGLRETYQTLWLRRADWDGQWHVLACLSLSCDRWWLVKLDAGERPTRIRAHMALPLGTWPSGLGDAFFADLTVFATGVAAQYADIQELIRRKKPVRAGRLRHRAAGPTRPLLPALTMRLSELLGPAPTPTQPHTAASSMAMALDSRSQRRTWASDFVHLLFRGIDTDGAATGERLRRRLGVLAEARLTVTDRAKLRLLGGRSEQGVAFNARTGQFSLYLRAAVGGSVIDALVARLQAIERVVGFLDAVRRESVRGVRCEAVTLRRLVFSYGDAGAKRWTVTIGLGEGEGGGSGDGDRPNGRDSSVRLRLERGCPHLRVVDFLGRVAADPATAAAVPFFLTTTLALHRALDRMEDAWEPIQLRNIGMIGIFPRALDWVVLRFLFPGPPQGRLRQLVLEIRLRARHGVPVWQVRRLESGPHGGGGGGGGSGTETPEDELSRVLRTLFERRGPGWKGLQTGAVASPFGAGEGGEGEGPRVPGLDDDSADGTDGAEVVEVTDGVDAAGNGLFGIEACLAALDDAVRALLPTPHALPPGMSMAQLQQRRAQAQAQAQQAHAQQAHAQQAQLQAQQQAQQQHLQLQQQQHQQTQLQLQQAHLQAQQHQQAQTARMG